MRLILVVTTIILLSTSSIFAQYMFYARTDYAAGNTPSSVFSIDLNGDGHNDLATANYFSYNVSILLGNGDGTFQPAVNYAAGSTPTSVFSIDLNGDGHNDLATANYNSDNVSILLGNGDGTFQSAVNYAAGDTPISVFSIDLNGDGHNDLATANYSDVSILLGNGDGTFQSAVNYGAGSGPLSVFSIDLNGDGHNDLATANYNSDNVSILLGNGDGTFQSAVNYAAGDEPLSVFSIDLNGDGHNDLATANWGSDNVSILLNIGNYYEHMVGFPDTLHALQQFAIEPETLMVILGNFFDGYEMRIIDPSSILLNDSLVPIGATILSEYPGFFGEVTSCSFLIPDILVSYGVLWDVTEQPFVISGQFTDAIPFTIEEEITVIGHLSGDANLDGVVNIADAIFTVNTIFKNGQQPRLPETADANCDGSVNIADVVRTIRYVFNGGVAPCHVE